MFASPGELALNFLQVSHILPKNTTFFSIPEKGAEIQDEKLSRSDSMLSSA